MRNHTQHFLEAAKEDGEGTSRLLPQPCDSGFLSQNLSHCQRQSGTLTAVPGFLRTLPLRGCCLYVISTVHVQESRVTFTGHSSHSAFVMEHVGHL